MHPSRGIRVIAWASSCPSVLLISILMAAASAEWPALAAEESPAETPQVGVTTYLDVVGRYVWRGYELNHKDPALQPSVTYAPPKLPGFSVNLWSSIGLGSDKGAGDTETVLDELALTAEYKRELIPSKLEATVQFLAYYNISDWSSNHGHEPSGYELSLRLDYTLHQYFVPYVAYFRGLDPSLKGNYTEFGISGSHQFSEQWSIAPSVQTAFSDQYDLGGKFSFVGLTLPATFQKGGLSITPYFSLVLPLEDLNGEGRRGIPFGGVSISYSF